ncbi:hypothetical protein E3N88_17749 [Mikania micrantha]|uniref:HAT C-terminal dimerisation domain-containing protein n=1 Tax=Mikania micrantha TaxID=192012 RepID=A0A5N6NUI5_9ASTR|nr:hypothetical protein E3N88_17749 [Mikania micrantha]
MYAASSSSRSQDVNFDLFNTLRQNVTKRARGTSASSVLGRKPNFRFYLPSAFSLSGRVLSIRRTRFTPASLEMCICLKDHLDAMERVQNHTLLEGELDVEATIHDVEVEEGMTFPLSDEEQAMDEWMRTNSPELQSEAPSED